MLQGRYNWKTVYERTLIHDEKVYEPFFQAFLKEWL